MEWYPHHIDDYDADTLQLTLAEDGAYCRLLRWYYKHERPLPDDDAALAVICRVSVDEWKALATKIRPMFVQRSAKTLHQRRCDKVLVEQNRRRKDAAKRQEKLRKYNVIGRAPRNDDVTRQSRVTNASVTLPEERRGEERKETEFASSTELDFQERDNLNIIPNPTIAPPAAPATPANGHDLVSEAVADWNAFAAKHSLLRVEKITKSRRAKVGARLKDCGGMDGWRAAIERIGAIPWMLGEPSAKYPDGWRVSLDSLIGEMFFTKLMEGVYDKASSQDAARRLFEKLEAEDGRNPTH